MVVMAGGADVEQQLAPFDAKILHFAFVTGEP